MNKLLALVLLCGAVACGRSGLEDLSAIDGTDTVPVADGTAGVGAARTPGAAGTTGIAGTTGVAGTTGIAGTTGVAGTGVALDPQNRCPCTRGPGRAFPPASSTCPPGAGTSAVAVIGPAGGQLALTTGPQGQQLRLDVPPGAVSQRTMFKVTELAVPTPYGFTDLTPIYLFEPVGLKLAPSAKLSVSWRIELAQGGQRSFPQGVQVYESPTLDGTWTPVRDSAVNAGFSVGSVERLQYIFVGYPFTFDPPYCLAP